MKLIGYKMKGIKRTDESVYIPLPEHVSVECQVSGAAVDRHNLHAAQPISDKSLTTIIQTARRDDTNTQVRKHRHIALTATTSVNTQP